MQQNIKKLVEEASKIVVIQADNPDGDSLASALALEQIIGDLGKEPELYCGSEVPLYLRYLPGWDRVSTELPKDFDLSIIVDTSAVTLLESLVRSDELKWIKAKKCLVIDHHQTEPTIDFATIAYLKKAVATGEIIYDLSLALDWPLNQTAREMVATAILADSMGLTSEGATAKSIRIIADLVEQGVSMAALENARRSLQKKSPEILAYKGRLLERIEYSNDQRIALIHIPWEEIEKYSYAYNPPMLVLDEMRQVEKVEIAIAFKTYPDGRITGKIRSNYGVPISAKVAEHFGGGGHIYAAGFKIASGKSLDEVKSECIKLTTKLLDSLKEERDHANL